MTLSKERRKKREEEETINMNIIILTTKDSRCWPLTGANSTTNTSVKPVTSGPRGDEKG